MKVFTSISELQQEIKPLLAQQKSIGFVPTMGALHAGHIALVSRSKQENEVTVCSIFVNPIQFNDKKDLARYPRTLEADISLLEEIDCDILFAPSVEEMYPSSTTPVAAYDFGDMAKVMEGASRPGHFDGVAIVVDKFFDIVTPTRAYFGQKDYQQLAIIQKMVTLSNRAITIVPCSTIRENSGLAMSSRNRLLSKEHLLIAPSIYQLLQEAVVKARLHTVEEVKQWFVTTIGQQPEFKLDYVAIVDASTLTSLNTWEESSQAMICIALYLGNIRLIDNIPIIL